MESRESNPSQVAHALETAPRAAAQPAADPGRNEPCPCGSGKKFKRCHGVGAAPKLGTPKAPAQLPTALPGTEGTPLAGFDPSKLDPEMMGNFMQAMQRLPRGQLQKLQTLVQKATSGKDVAREAAELERSLPPQFQEMMRGFAMQAGMMMAGEQNDAAEMTAEEARSIVEKAAKEGKVNAAEAQSLLDAAPSPEKKSLWARIRGK